MKYTAVIAVLCLLVVAGCNESNLSLSGNPESDGIFSVSGGTEIVKNLEVGASANYMKGTDRTTTNTTWAWKKWSIEKTVDSETEKVDEWGYGAYLKWLFPDLVDGITPYIGAQVPVGNGTWNITNDISPLGGVRIPIGESLFLSAEYQQETVFGEERKWMFGGGIKF